jgi:TPR repeat protein
MSTGRFQRFVTAAWGAAALLLMTACAPPPPCPGLPEAERGACKPLPLLECPTAPDLVPPGWNDMARFRDPRATAGACPTEDATGASQLRLARLMNEEGQPAFALKWYRLALAKGQAEAHKELANMLLARGSDAAALAEARELYRQAGEAGDAGALLALARTYMDPPGGEPELDQARLWLGRADEAGELDATYALARLLEQAANPAEPKRAVDLYHKAARAGHSEAREALMRSSEGKLRLARMYEQGEGVAQDDCEAVVWYIGAAAGEPRIDAAASWVVANVPALADEVTRAIAAKGEGGLQLLVAKRFEADKPGCAVRLYKMVLEKERVQALAGLGRIGTRYEATAPERALTLYASLADDEIDLGWEGLQRMCTSGDDAACMAQGKRFERRGDVKRAQAAYGVAAGRGHDPARTALDGLLCDGGDNGACTRRGALAEANGEQDAAKGWYHKAAERGHQPAVLALAKIRCVGGENAACMEAGNHYNKLNDALGALAWYHRAATRGHVAARVAAADIRCRSLGDGEACADLGTVYSAQIDEKLVFEHLHRGVVLNNARAMVALANLLMQGRAGSWADTLFPRQQAGALYERAVALGNLEARGRLEKWRLDEAERRCKEEGKCATNGGVSAPVGATNLLPSALTQYALLRVLNAMGCTLSIEIDGVFERHVPPGFSTTIRVTPGTHDVQAICSYGANDTRRVHYDGNGFVGGETYDWKLED